MEKRLKHEDSKMAKIESQSSENCKTRTWLFIKMVLLLVSIICIILNVLVVKHLRHSFMNEINALMEQGGDSVDSLAVNSEPASSSNGKRSGKLMDVLSLLERYEKAIKAPNTKQVVVAMGKSFILKRDFDIWDYSFKKQNHSIALSNMHNLQQGVHPDWTVLKCLDLFDGKSHCIEPTDLLTLKRYQRVSRLFGLRKALWNKDRFCETMAFATRGYDDLPYEFVFPCWIMPTDFVELIKEAKTKYQNRSFILKPTDRGEGNGIIVMDDWRQLTNWKSKFPDNDEIVVQTYLPNPFLIKQRKWDMRTYVLVTSINPLRVYMYRDGLVRFASSKYEKDAKAGGKATSFLTNTSINKKAGVAVEDLTWPFARVWTYLIGIGIDPEMLWNRIERAVVQLLLSAEPSFVKQFKKLQNDFTCVNCYQLLGVDVIVDDDLVPRVIEVNGEPSMQLSGEDNSQYDYTKKSMAHDLITLLYSADTFSRSLAQDFTEMELEGFNIGFEALGCSSSDDICLRKNDVEYLLESKKEQQNMGGFRRIYPHKEGNYYDKFIAHLDTKFPYGSVTSTAKIHNLVTDLEKISRVKSKNSVPEGALKLAVENEDDDQEEA